MNRKLRTKILTLAVAFVIGVILSIALSWVLIQIFTKNPSNILNFTPIIMFDVFKIEEGVQIFFLILICFLLLLAFSVFKIFNLDDYLSKTYRVTKEIRIPLPVGKEQYQQGSSWWLDKKDFKNVFGVNTFDPANSTISQLLKFAEKERVKEKDLIEHPEKIVQGKNTVTETVKPIFKKGGLVVGKKDRTIFNPTISKIFNKFPILVLKKRKVEDIYYIKDDMHSLTVGATRSGKTRCLVLQTISNISLSGENMIISDPKGELYEYTSQSLKELGYNVLTLDFKSPLKSSKYNFLQPVIEQVEKGDIPKALNYCSDIAESLVGDVGNREAIWVNGEKSVIKTGIMAVVIGNSEDKITDEKIKILLKEKYEEEFIDKGINNVTFDEYLEAFDVEEMKLKYSKLSKEEKTTLREKYFVRVLDNFYQFIKDYLSNVLYFNKFLDQTKTEEENKKNLRNELHYNLDTIFKELEDIHIGENQNIKKIEELLSNWKILNELRPHPEFQNLPNVYNFISVMCAEQSDGKMLMDTYLKTLPQNSPVVQQFAPARIAPSKTRASFFTSALATLNIFIDDYVASMIDDSEIDINNFNKEKSALFMILPDEKTTFYGLCSLFVNQAYTKLVELADDHGGRLNIRTNFVLDEFGNFSAIPNFGGFLTVGGGRGIRFNLFIQSFSQLNDKYGDNTAKNILDNCHIWNYLKTSNFETAEMISKKLRNIYLFNMVYI